MTPSFYSSQPVKSTTIPGTTYTHGPEFGQWLPASLFLVPPPTQDRLEEAK